MTYQKKKFTPYPRNRYKKTAWRQGAKAHIKKVATQYKQRFGTPRFMARNVLSHLRAARAAKNMWAAHYHKYKHVKVAKGRALAAQTNWRWRQAMK